MMKKFFCITDVAILCLAAALAFSGSFILLFDGGVNFGHTLYLLPVSGALIYILKKTVSMRGGVLISVILVFAGITTESLLNGYDLSLFLAGLMLNFVCFGLGGLIAYLFDKALFKKAARIPTRILSAVLAVALCVSIAYPLMLFFGDPVSALKSKNKLNEWLKENPDANSIVVEGFNYDWYDAVYYYEIKDSETRELGKLIYRKADGSVTLSWKK